MYSSTLSLTSALERDGWSTPRPGRFTPRKDPVHIVQEAGLAPGPVWTSGKNLAPTAIRSPDRPASQYVYRNLFYDRPSHVLCVPFQKHVFNEEVLSQTHVLFVIMCIFSCAVSKSWLTEANFKTLSVIGVANSCYPVDLAWQTAYLICFVQSVRTT
jgi:hypothetical protein